ncbi:MAG TPA: hypothetical protein VGH10_00635 [Actinomycetota bacterium]|jgi:hypothetical protein
MGEVVGIQAWRARHVLGLAPAGTHPAGSAVATETDDQAEGPSRASIARLERAIARLDGATASILGRGARLDPETETALLAIVGEVSMGLLDEAAARSEDLATRLAEGI